MMDSQQLRAHIAALEAENAKLRGLVIRAQIIGDRLPVSWHNDADAALEGMKAAHP